MIRRVGLIFVLACAAGFVLFAPGGAFAATTVNVTPATPATVPDNSFPFGVGATPNWRPFFGFVYKNVPGFQLKAGDILSFDLLAMNDADIQLQIDLAPTSTNGGDAPAGPFTTVVTNTETPANPRGDTTFENYELAFTAQVPFNFAGGGLAIRFSNPSPTYAADAIQDGVLGGTSASDPSGFFVERYFRDDDGMPPYTNTGTTDSLAGFRLTLADVSSAAGSTGQRDAALKKCKKKAKKKDWPKKKLKKCKKKAKKLPI